MNLRQIRILSGSLVAFALALSMVVTAGCQRRSHLPETTKVTVTDIGSLRIPDKELEKFGLKNEWVRQAPDGPIDAAYVVGDDLYAVAPPHRPSHPYARLICYKRTDGLHRWFKKIMHKLNHPPTFFAYPPGPEAKPAEVIFDQGDKIVCVEHDNGHSVWEIQPKYSVSSGVGASETHIYVGSYNNNIYAHRKGENFDDWPYITLDEVSATPTVDGLNVYVTSGDGYAYKFHATKGPDYEEFARNGRLQTGAAITASPVVYGGQIYLASTDFKLYSLYESQFSEAWAFQAEAPIEKTPVVADFRLKRGSTTVVLCEARDDRRRINTTTLWAVNATDGSRLWKTQNVKDIIAISRKAIYVTLSEKAGRGKVIVSLDPNTGKENFALSVDQFDIIPPSCGTSPADRKNHRSLIYLVHKQTGFIQAIGENY